MSTSDEPSIEAAPSWDDCVFKAFIAVVGAKSLYDRSKVKGIETKEMNYKKGCATCSAYWYEPTKSYEDLEYVFDDFCRLSSKAAHYQRRSRCEKEN